ncbi:MAG: universal stress protein [Candidatus Bipolaricaulia bacterium]
MNKILVPIAHAERDKVDLEFGAQLVQAASANLTVLHVIKTFSTPIGINVTREKMAEWGVESGPFKLLKQAEEILESMGLFKLDESGAPVERHALKALGKGLYEVHLIGRRDENIRFRLREGDVVREVLREVETAEDDPYSLVIMETRGRKRLQRILHGSITQKVAFHVPCSVLVTKNLHPRENILVCTRGYWTALEAARQAGELANAIGAQVKVLAVAEQDDQVALAESHAQEILDVLSQAGIQGQAIIRVGDPAEVIIHEAGEDHIIVLGRTKESKLQKFFRGSIPLQVLEHAASPVMIAVPPPSSNAASQPTSE